MPAVRDDVDVARRKARRRALDIEAGLVWMTLFGTQPTWHAWNATRARKTGHVAFGRDQLGFTSRIDGKWRQWPSPQRIAKDFAHENAGMSGMDSYRAIIKNLRKTLRDLQTPYVPIVVLEQLQWAELQARARARSGPQPIVFFF